MKRVTFDYSSGDIHLATPGSKEKPLFIVRVLHKTFAFLASLKLAVVVVLSLATIAGWGTIVESRFDAMTAKKLVYESVWMYLVLIMLILNLIFSAVERIPWKKRHIPFLLAHVGIIIIILGAFITQRYGLDGSMAIGIGESSSLVSVNESEVRVFETFTGEYYDRLFSQTVDFLKNPPQDDPLEIKIAGNGADRRERSIRIIDFMPYARRESDVVPVQYDSAGPAIRFQLQNQMTSVSEWIVHDNPMQPAVFDMGPARIALGNQEIQPTGRNEILLETTPDPDVLRYRIYSAKDPKAVKTGTVKAGSFMQVPWMGFTFRLLKYLPHANWQDRFTRLDRPTPLSTSAILIDFDGQQSWVGHNSLKKLFSDKSSFVLSYGNVRIPLGFQIHLDKFEIGRYPGSAMAQSYQSHVNVEKVGPVLISMNQPLKHEGYTFYQASFVPDETGAPTTSVLSVNKDPGRGIKYLGSILLVSGIIYLFSQKNKQRERASNSKGV